MVSNYEIKNLSDVLSLGPKQKLIKYTTKNLTKPGENYGSLMLALEVTVRNESDGSEEVLKLAAKLCPENEWIAKMFNVPVTFKKENAFYAEIVPTLQNLQRSEGVENVMDFFPKYFGSRISLDPNSNTVDKDAVLLLENLKFAGYETVDCTKGFDLPTAELILKDLAVFHAAPIALKMKNPELFEKKLEPYIQFNKNFGEFSEETEKKSLELMVSFIESSEEHKHLASRVMEGLKKGNNTYKDKGKPKEPFATMTHMDYWVNNTMVKFSNGKPVKNSMVDFQLIEYGSPGADIIFFIFSSIQKDVIDKHYDHLIGLYYLTFIDTLKALKCDIEPFTFELFQEELRNEAINIQFFHVMLMQRPIHSKKDELQDLSEMGEEDLLRTDTLSDLYPIRLREIAVQFAEKNWI